MKNSILIQAWVVYKFEDNYYIEYTHSIYLKNIEKIYKNIHLISPVKIINELQTDKYCKISKDVIVFEIPYFTSYMAAYKLFLNYLKVYKKVKGNNYNTVYSRFPNPFGWLQKIFFKCERVVHFVGDPIDTLIKNPNLNIFTKILKSFFFLPEYFLFLWSCHGNNVKVYSNGYHISNRLKKFKVNVVPVISTTLVDSDFFVKNKKNKKKLIKLIYVGYLRKAKGVHIIIDAFKILSEKYPDQYALTIVGSGEEENFLREKGFGLNIKFLGHINNREELNSILRNHDIFCFASLSEGSPRVILEAIANGLNVITTPVGSLPYIFKDKEDLLYFDYNNVYQLLEKIHFLSNNLDIQNSLYESSLSKINKFKVENFIIEVFNA